MTEIGGLLRALHAAGVEFPVVGSVAAVIHGSARLTQDLGVVYRRSDDLGAIDLLGEITGGGGYEDLLPHSRPVSAFGIELRCLGLPQLIRVKRAAGRPKDLEATSELEALLAEIDGPDRRCVTPYADLIPRRTRGSRLSPRGA